MLERSTERNLYHISLVREQLHHFYDYPGLENSEIDKRAELHDASKFFENEKHAYACLTFFYDQKKSNPAYVLPRLVESMVSEGIEKHSLINTHHPEAHFDINQMPLIDLVEMVCDWTAIAIENCGPNATARTWASDNLNKKWKFNSENQNLIFNLIDELDHKRGLYE